MKTLRFPRKPSKASWLQFVYFNFGGVVFFVSGYFVFALLYGLFGWHWLIAKGLADIVGWTLNYFIQHYLAFHEDSKKLGHRKVLKKYVPFSLFNVLIDYAIVGGLKALGVTPFIGLWVSSIFFTIWKYVWYRFWVFRHRS